MSAWKRYRANLWFIFARTQMYTVTLTFRCYMIMGILRYLYSINNGPLEGTLCVVEDTTHSFGSVHNLTRYLTM